MLIVFRWNIGLSKRKWNLCYNEHFLLYHIYIYIYNDRETYILILEQPFLGKFNLQLTLYILIHFT